MIKHLTRLFIYEKIKQLKGRLMRTIKKREVSNLLTPLNETMYKLSQKSKEMSSSRILLEGFIFSIAFNLILLVALIQTFRVVSFL